MVITIAALKITVGGSMSDIYVGLPAKWKIASAAVDLSC
jgi:hypothetical protein